MGRVDLDDLQSERRYGALRTYGSAKLMNIMFTYELARRLDSSGVAVNVLHPGFVATNFGRDSNRAIRFFYRIARPFERNSHEGAKTSVYLASSPEVEGVSGKYFYESKPTESSSASYDIERQKQLWLATESILAGLGVGLRKQEYSVVP
jgi:hypothetical protein